MRTYKIYIKPETEIFSGITGSFMLQLSIYNEEVTTEASNESFFDDKSGDPFFDD